MDNLYLDINWLNENGSDLIEDIHTLTKDKINPDIRLNMNTQTMDITEIINNHMNPTELQRFFCIANACRTLLGNAYRPLYTPIGPRQRILMDYDVVNKMYLFYRQEKEDYIKAHNYLICYYDIKLLERFVMHDVVNMTNDINDLYNRFMEPILKTVETPMKGL